MTAGQDHGAVGIVLEGLEHRRNQRVHILLQDPCGVLQRVRQGVSRDIGISVAELDRGTRVLARRRHGSAAMTHEVCEGRLVGYVCPVYVCTGGWGVRIPHVTGDGRDCDEVCGGRAAEPVVAKGLVAEDGVHHGDGEVTISALSACVLGEDVDQRNMERTLRRAHRWGTCLG